MHGLPAAHPALARADQGSQAEGGGEGLASCLLQEVSGRQWSTLVDIISLRVTLVKGGCSSSRIIVLDKFIKTRHGHMV